MKFPPINLWSIPKQKRDYDYEQDLIDSKTLCVAHWRGSINAQKLSNYHEKQAEILIERIASLEQRKRMSDFITFCHTGHYPK